MKKSVSVLGAIVIAGVCVSAIGAQAQVNLMDVGKGLLKSQIGTNRTPSSDNLGANLSAGEIGSGLKEALKVASERVTSRLGATDGFNADPTVHIPLPDKLRMAQQGLNAAGQSALLDDLELKLNRAAEAATPKARKIFTDALSRMTLDDAKGILNGPSDAATQYFKRAMSPDLKTAMRPVVDQTVADSGAVKAYGAATTAASALPMVGKMVQGGPGQLTDYVLDSALSGIFIYLAKEEAAIRNDPAKRSTELLRKVFG